MSEDKTIKVLESLGGSAELGDIRRQAKKLYPDKQLWRTIHTPLKTLLAKKKVKCRGKLRRGGRHNAPKTFWTLANIEELVPPVKTAAELLKEIPMHEDVPVINTNILTPPAPPPIIESDARYTETMNKIKHAITEPVAQELEPIHDGTIAHEIRQAIKEPYLDKLAKLPEKIEKIETKYRGRHDIVYDILRYIKNEKHGTDIGVHVTEIMYKTMLSHWQLKKYLLICMKNELIDKTDVGYKITDKGLKYSDTMDSIPINFD